MTESMGLNDVRTIEVAKAIATIAHRGQVDKAGNPYIDHPRRVADLVSQQGADVIAAAWLHDVIEDTDVTCKDLEAAGMGRKVIWFVELLTRTDDQKAEDYYEALRVGPQGAWHVKLADIADNTNPARLALLDDATIVRLTRKYAKARKLLGATDD